MSDVSPTFTPGGAIDQLILHPVDTLKEAASEASTAYNTGKTVLTMTVGDYTLVAVGIILAIGALLISSKPTVIKAVGTVKDAATLAA